MVATSFNAVSGTERTPSHVVGPYGSGIPNDNTERLISFCTGARLRICGSWFPRKDIHRYTWYSNDGTTRKEIDHILVNTRWKAIINCRINRKLEWDSDHYAVIGTLSTRLKRTTSKTSAPRRYDISSLQDPNVKHAYAVDIHNRYSALAEGMETDWGAFKDAMQQAAGTTLGTRKPPKKEWISDSTRDLVEKKRKARLAGAQVEYKQLNRACKKSALADKQTWLDGKIREAEQDMVQGRVRDAFANFRQLRAACRKTSSPISAQDGILLCSKEAKLARWREYYMELLNRPATSVSADLKEAAMAAEEDPSIDQNASNEDEVLRESEQ